ncbi:MAG: hypothetical protein LBT48_05345 [Prevotellaceae bacterium]|nr:hypothetical protein [Prevotellaceae bacterium]
MKKYSISLWLFAATVLLCTVSCRKDDTSQVDSPSTPVRTIVVDDEMAKKLQSFSDSKLVFTGLSGNETPEVGNIICSAPIDKAPYGFFYGVKSVTKDGNNTIIETKAASIADAVGKDSISVTAPLGTIGDITISETIGSATLTGSFTGGKYELNFSAAVNERKTTYLKVSCTASGTFTLTVDGTLYITSEELNKLLTTIEPDPITITMAGIPIVITPKIPVSFYAKYDGPFNGSIITAKHAYSAEAGVLYKDGKLTNYHEDHSPTARPFLTKLDMILSGSIVTSIRSDVSWQYYNHAAVTDAAIGLYGRVATQHLALDQPYSNGIDDPTLLAVMGDNSRVTAAPTEFGINAKIDNLADSVEYTTLKQKVFPEFEPIVLSNITDNSATARTTITSPTLTWIYPVTEHGLCWGTTAYPDVTSYSPAPHTSLGALNATGTIIEAQLTGLETGTPYFIRPYFKNSLGTFYGNFKYQGTPITPCPAGQSVTVGDITWACSNLGAAGVFTSPDSVGAYFRWNRLEWDDELSHIPQLSDVWTVNPCPEGWMLPSTNEIMNSFGGGSGKLKECVANVDGRLATGLCYETTTEGILFFPHGGYLDNDGVTLHNINEVWITLNYLLHQHTTEYTFLLTYYGLLSSNLTGYYHVSIPLSVKGEGSGYPVRCMKDPWW